MNDLPSWFLPLLVFVFGSGGPLAGIYLWLKQRKKDPIDYATAQVANAAAISNVAKNVVDMVSDQINDLRQHSLAQDAKTVEQGVQIMTQDTKIFGLEKRIQNIEATWTIWYNDLSERWELHRKRDTAPPAPNIRRHHDNDAK